MTDRDLLACGDLIAQRRHAYGRAAADDGDWLAAADMFAQAAERAADWPPAWFALGEARERLDDMEGAAAAYRAALAADPSDALGAAMRLALLGAEGPLAALPAAYVARLFDDYAPRFDSHLQDALGYRGPALLVAALAEAAPGRHFASALDLGCGTGLMGAAMRSRVARLAGVDIAPRMIEKTRERGLHDDLALRDALAFLENSAPGAFDVILAADLFPYFGDLGPVLAACRGALADDGLLAFSVETRPGKAFGLLPTLRFAHARSHVETAAGRAGMKPLLVRPASIRREAGGETPGLVCVYGTQ